MPLFRHCAVLQPPEFSHPLSIIWHMRRCLSKVWHISQTSNEKLVVWKSGHCQTSARYLELDLCQTITRPHPDIFIYTGLRTFAYVFIPFSYDSNIFYNMVRKRTQTYAIRTYTYANIYEHTQTCRNLLVHTALYILDMI